MLDAKIFYRKFVPGAIKKRLYGLLHKEIRKSELILKDKITSYYKGCQEEEITDLLTYIDKNKIQYINYSFMSNYLYRKVKVYTDQDRGLYYVMHNGKRMYFKRGMRKDFIVMYYNSICAEQDLESPHSYFRYSKLFMGEDMVVCDCGAAEGNFALDMVEHCKKIYICECEEAWLEALEATFEPYRDKVVIVNKYISDTDTDDTITLDTLAGREEKLDLIKIDVEGEEIKVLSGAVECLNKYNPTILACVYHYQEEEREVSDFMGHHDFVLSSPYRYLLHLNDPKLDSPYLRRGVLTFTKKLC